MEKEKRIIVMEFPKSEREIECYSFIKFRYKAEECYALEFKSQSGKIKYAHLVLENGDLKLSPFRTMDDEMKFKSRCRTALLYSFNYDELPLGLLPNYIGLCSESLERKKIGLVNDVVDYKRQVFNGLVSDINVLLDKLDDEGKYQNINFYDFFQIDGYSVPLAELLNSQEYLRLDSLFDSKYLEYFDGSKKTKYQDLCDYYNIFKKYVLYSNNSKKMYDTMYVF